MEILLMSPRTRRVAAKDGHFFWIVIDSDRKVVQPVKEYLIYLRNIESSPNTLKNYAGHLSKFWEYLEYKELNWRRISLKDLSDYMVWLRYPTVNVQSVEPCQPLRQASTVNTMLTVVHSFYEFQRRSGVITDMYAYRHLSRGSYKPFLHHLSKSRPIKTKLVRLKEPKTRPRTLEKAAIRQIILACESKRDEFLVTLLSETGMRIGQALGLRHSDIESWNNRILIVPRTDNANGARAKAKFEYVVDVPPHLMELYGTYISGEYPQADSDYVFVNIWSGHVGDPMTYDSATRLLRTLRRKTQLDFHWHMFRHTHATDLIRAGWKMAFVQKRLGHQSVQTTIDTYTHISDQDLQSAYQRFIER